MIGFSDQPYRDFPPKPNRLIAAFLRWFNRRRYLPHTLRIDRVEVRGADALEASLRPTDKLLLLPNHSTHADAAILLEACRQAGLAPRFMAAYDVFLRSWLTAFVMQRLGAFSVDREGSDSRAMKRALAILTDPDPHAGDLTIFPEGNVYLQNDRITPFHDGAAFLALRAAKQLAEQGGRLLAVPVSIKVTHVEDVRAAVASRLGQLGRDVDAPVDPAAAPLEALRQVGQAALRRNLKHRGLPTPEEEDLPTLIRAAADRVLTSLEQKLGLPASVDADLIGRVRAARQAIHAVRLDASRAADHAAARAWADEAMVAFRIASYAGDYVADHPTVDRIAETAEKLAEDVYDREMPPLGVRRAVVRFNDAIDVGPYLSGRKTREATEALTRDVEAAVQDGVEQINAGSEHVGSQVWTDRLGAEE